MYFSGFCLDNEQKLFDDYLINNDFTVVGFSYGAIKAVEYILATTKRVDTLQLFSPAYFNDKDIKYKRMQLMFFKKDPINYSDTFLNNCGISNLQKEYYFKLGTSKQLEELLYYQWDINKLQSIKNRGINIEIYLGGNDKIIDTLKAKEFFKEFGEVYFIKEASHILVS